MTLIATTDGLIDFLKALCLIFDGLLIVDKVGNKGKTQLLLYRMFCLSIGSVSLLLLRLKAMHFRGPEFQRGDNPSSFEPSLPIRAVNYSYIYAINAWLLAMPDWLCYDWSMSCIRLITTPTDWRSLFVLLFWFSLFLLIRSSLLHPNLVVKRYLC